MAVAVTKSARVNDAVRGGALEILTVTGVDPGSCTAGAEVDVAITSSGITANDKVLAVTVLTKDASTGLLTIAAAICTTDTITVSFGNPSAGTLNGGEVTLMIVVLKAAL